MTTSSTKQLIFFIFIGIFYTVFYIVTSILGGNVKTPKQNYNKTGLLLIIISACFFSLLTLGYAQITGLFKEKYHNTHKQNINPRLCQGGAYTWQGNSPRAKACRELASTPEGSEQIQRYECGKGFRGMPGHNFKFTPIADQTC